MQKILSFCHQCMTALVKAGQPLLALRLYLFSAAVANNSGSEKAENITYEFISQVPPHHCKRVSTCMNRAIYVPPPGKC